VMYSAWLKATTAQNWRMAFNGGTQLKSITTAWAQYFHVVRSISSVALERNSNANQSLYVDDVSVKPITLASMFSTRPYSTHATTKAAVTLVSGTRAGVVCNLDNAASPANFVIASHDGSVARLTKCVAGTYTELISTAVAYSAGAFVEVRRAAGGNDYELYYNGSKVGTTQTIADAGITGNVLGGYFNTYDGNTVLGFSSVPA
jgi:hypothetical protein